MISASERLSLRDYALLAVLAFAMFLPGFSSLPPVDRDESRYVVASTQMIDSRDFVDIRFQEGPRYLQPAGVYWLQSASAALFTSPEARAVWAYRVPSLLAAIAAALMTAGFAAALFGRLPGLAAGAVLAASFSLGFEARIAKIDATLLAAVTLAQVSLLTVYLDRAARPKATAAVFWAALGAGMMLKGPIILIVSGTTIAALCLWDRNAGWLKRLHAAWGVGLMLLIVLPWYVAIGVVSDGYFYERSVGKNLFGKVATGQQAHGGPPGYHLALFPLMFWPGSLFAALAIPFVWLNRARPEVRFLVAWIAPTWIVYEIVATKLPHYVLPTYPAIAALAAAALFAPRAFAPGRWWKVGAAVFGLVWLLGALIFAALGPVAFQQFEGSVDPLALTMGALAAILSVATLWFAFRGPPVRALGAALGAALCAWMGIWGFTAPRLDSVWMSPRIVEAAQAAAPCPDGPLATTPYHEPSLVFLWGYDRTRLANDPRQAADMLAQDRACGLALVDQDGLGAFEARAAEIGLPVEVAGSVAGRNYSDGRELDLTIFRATRRPVTAAPR